MPRLIRLFLLVFAPFLANAAGVPVLTRIGGHEQRQNVEDILPRPGLEFWARDEVTGEEGWRPVVRRFVTHPDTLYTLGIDTDGDGTTDETIRGTAPHPFWVNQARTFVPMGDLIPGHELSLAHGGTATVTENTRERAPPGQTFTTYNFEVAEFHTYYVGEAGVWVHNFSNAFCEELFAKTNAIASKHGIPVDGNRFRILDEALQTSEVDSYRANFAMHATGIDELAAYNGGNPDVIWSYKKQKVGKHAPLHKDRWGAAGKWEVHNLCENRISIALRLDHVADDSPSINLPRRRSDFTEEELAHYREKFDREPVFHQNTGNGVDPDGIAQNIGKIFDDLNLPKNQPLGSGDQLRLLDSLKDLYSDQRYGHLNLWPVTRDWIKREMGSSWKTEWESIL